MTVVSCANHNAIDLSNPVARVRAKVKAVCVIWRICVVFKDWCVICLIWMICVICVTGVIWRIGVICPIWMICVICSICAIWKICRDWAVYATLKWFYLKICGSSLHSELFSVVPLYVTSRFRTTHTALSSPRADRQLSPCRTRPQQSNRYFWLDQDSEKCAIISAIYNPLFINKPPSLVKGHFFYGWGAGGFWGFIRKFSS